MNNENEERALIKKLKILDGKLNIKLEWPYSVVSLDYFSSDFCTLS